jgi:hypothetical protein
MIVLDEIGKQFKDFSTMGFVFIDTTFVFLVTAFQFAILIISTGFSDPSTAGDTVDGCLYVIEDPQEWDGPIDVVSGKFDVWN